MVPIYASAVSMSDGGPRKRNGAEVGEERPSVQQRADQIRSSRQIDLTELCNEGLTALADAWRQACELEGQAPPSRAQFHPTDVTAALGRITVLERIPAESGPGHTWRYRLVGTEITMALQAEITGKPIDYLHAAWTDMLRRQFDQAATEGIPLAFTVDAIVDRRLYRYEKVVLPVRSAPGSTTDQIVVASYPINAV